LKGREIMTFADKAIRYAKAHPQEVTLAWIDNSKRTYTADKAARLCGVPRVAACVVGAECKDKRLEDMLNNLLDDE